MACASKTSALRQLMDDGATRLSTVFNAARSGISHTVSDRLGTHSSAATGEAKTGQASAGQVSAFGLRPISMGEKLKHIAQMIKKGTLALGNGISLDTIRDEMKKHDGLGIHQMVEVLAKKNLLKLVKKHTPAAPAPAY